MLHRMKEELARQKTANLALQGELEASRSSEGGSRNRNLNGRGTPISEDSHDGPLRPQILEIQRQNQRLISENQDLRRRFDSVDHDLELMRDSLVASQQEAEAKAVEIERLEREIDRLEDSLSFARQTHDTSFVDRLGAENALLQRKNAELSKKIELLLEVDQAGFDRNRPLSNFSNQSTDHPGDFEAFYTELDDWHRKLAGSSIHTRIVDEGISH
jgi:chromosome segregation ATPase